MYYLLTRRQRRTITPPVANHVLPESRPHDRRAEGDRSPGSREPGVSKGGITLFPDRG